MTLPSAALSPIVLPLPDGTLPLHPTLALVEALEDASGSLYALARRLLAGEASHTELLHFLAALYRHSQGGAAPPEDFLLTLPAAALATEVLAAILTPLSRIDIAREGAAPGEGLPAAAGL